MKSTLHSLLPILGIALGIPFARADSPPDCRCAQADAAGPRPRGGFAMMVSDVVQTPESVAFLGVETEPASETLTEQLGLPENTGLVVGQVVPGSAAAASLKRHDLLLKLDDQVLIEPRQLAVLVRGHKAGDTVTITYLRAGKQETAAVKLGAHDDSKVAEWGATGVMPPSPPERGFDRDDMDRVLSLMNGDGNSPAWLPPVGPGAPRSPEPPAEPGISEVRIDMANSNIVYTDDKGTLTLTVKDGKRSLVATDAHGRGVLFTGPIDTPEERRALPPEVREWLKKLHGLQEFRFRADHDFKGGQAGVLQPQGQEMPLPNGGPAQPPQPPF